jgi:hypothetical protein
MSQGGVSRSELTFNLGSLFVGNSDAAMDNILNNFSTCDHDR